MDSTSRCRCAANYLIEKLIITFKYLTIGAMSENPNLVAEERDRLFVVLGHFKFILGFFLSLEKF